MTKQAMTDSWEDIRPYEDAEIPAAMERLAGNPDMLRTGALLRPDLTGGALAKLLRSCRSTDDFQRHFMYPLVCRIIDTTTDGVEFQGLERLDPGQHYLFVANHRDIVLDAAFLMKFLFDKDFPRPQISFGANLMASPFLVDIGKANRMYKVERPETAGSLRSFLDASMRLSRYIAHVIRERRENVWIAQRNGRTKNGRDETDPGIIKMFSLYGGEDRAQALADLHIVPVCISYEWEPCDMLKAAENAQAEKGVYVKAPGEDLVSIRTGIAAPKGRVSLTVCEPLTAEDLSAFDTAPWNQFNRSVAALIDKRLHAAYRIWPNNLIARDLLTGGRDGGYTPAQRSTFVQRMEEALSHTREDLDRNRLRQLYLELYAAPCDFRAQSGQQPLTI